MNNEIWKPIFEGVYEVSDLGRIKRAVGGKGTRAGTIIKQPVDSAGYCVTTFCINGKRNPIRTHQKVCPLSALSILKLLHVLHCWIWKYTPNC